MSRALLVTGATGTQGGALIDALFANDDDFLVLAVTRNAHSAGARRTAAKSPSKMRLVQGDLDDAPALFASARAAAPAGVPVWGVFSVQVMLPPGHARAGGGAGPGAGGRGAAAGQRRAPLCLRQRRPRRRRARLGGAHIHAAVQHQARPLASCGPYQEVFPGLDDSLKWWIDHGYDVDVAKLRQAHPGLLSMEEWLRKSPYVSVLAPGSGYMAISGILTPEEQRLMLEWL